MNLRKIALGLLFGGALAVGSVACDDSSSSSGGGGTPVVNLPTQCATLGSDTDSAMSPRVVISSLSLPATDGFNIDGINNAARGGAGGGVGRTIPGCDEQDIAGGKDNSLAKVAASLAATIDLNAALDTVVQPGGSLMIEAQLNHLASADVATDPCVGATIFVTPMGGTTTMYQGSGAIDNHVASLAFGDFLSFTVALTVPPASCDAPGCNPASLSIRVDKPIATIHMNAANTQIEAGSIIGGFIFFEDTTGTAGYDNASGFKTALLAYTQEVNLMASLEGTAVGAFDGARDLHMNPDRTISPCTAPGGNAALVNRNSVSVALSVDSL